MSTRKALAFSFLDRYSGLLLAIISSMVLARLLTPAEVGIFSVTMVLLSYLSSLRDLGAGQYLLQEKELTQERIRATWTVQLGLGLLFSLVVFLASHPVSVFYNEPRIRNIMLVLSLNFAISPFGSLTYAWLMREMRFESLAIMRFAGSLSGACTSIALAWKGWGPISLAYGSLVSTIANALIAMIFRPATFPWVPGFREIRRVLSFGGKITITTVVNTFAYSASELVLGKLQGMASAGLFSRANGLATMFHRLILDATHAVALPLFAKESREKGNATQAFMRATSYITAIGWSFFLGMIFLAQPVIRLLYGAQWDGAVDLTRLLAVAAMVGVPASLCVVILTANGSIKIVVRATLLNAAQYVTAVVIGASQGLIGLGIALIAANAVSMTTWLRFTRKQTGFTWKQLADTLARSATVALASGIFPALVFVWFGPYPTEILAPLILSIPGSLCLFVAAIFLCQHPLKEEVLRIWARVRMPWKG
ncbi:MAG TPA: lipopolysaccharide biosynthesis protein [Burkholderiaceae bacterium]|nr:lipopolysaccharide biosynthesis protein [Burkholderiaceae bacterium]